MYRPIFSVLIANYNNSQFLDACISSIFHQTYQDFEIVIFDDASTDNSKEIYKKYAHNEKVRIFSNAANKGVGFTKHQCIMQAKGEICGFVDPDDALVPDALESLVSLHVVHLENSIIYSTHYICNEHLAIQQVADYVGQIPPDKKSAFIYRPIISHFASFKRNLYLLTEGISPLYLKAADKDLYFKLEETGPVLFLNRPLYYYRNHANSISLNTNVQHAYCYELTAKFYVIARSKQKRNTLQAMHNSLSTIIDGVLYVCLIEWERKKHATAFSLLWSSFMLFPSITMKRIIIKLLSR
jgi:glycosyltransferase involved in cell wall biosynthesis